MANLVVGVGLEMGQFWRELGQVRTALGDVAAKPTTIGVGVQGSPSGGGGGDSALVKDVATAALAAKAAAGTIASPFLSLRVELRALGLEMSGQLRQGAKEMENAGKSLKDVAQESAVQAGRLRQEDLEKHAARLRGAGPAAAPTAGAFNVPTGPIHAAGGAAEVATGRFRKLGTALAAAGGVGAVALAKLAGGSAAAAGAAGGVAGAFVALQAASAAAGAAVGVASVAVGGAVAAMAPFVAGAAAGVVALKGLSNAAKEIRAVGLAQWFKNARASFAEANARWIQGVREFKVNLEGIGKILNVIPGAPMRASMGVIKGVVGLFMSYEDRVKAVSRRMGLLEVATRAAANVAAQPFKTAANAAGRVGRMGGGFALMGAAAVAGMGLATKAGSDLNETISKVGTVFGNSAGAVEASADKMAAAYGTPKAEYMDSVAAIGLIGKAAGQTEAQAAKFGDQFTKLSLDMMSFYNVPIDEAMKAIRSGLVGETEPMRRFGVLLSADRVEAEGLRMGLVQVGEEMTEQAKVVARSNLIMRGLSDANGDLARTADAPANLMRTLAGRVENLASTIGQALMPGVQAFLSLLNQMAGAAEDNAGPVVGAFEWLGGAIKAIVDGIALVYNNWGEITNLVSLTIQARIRNIGEAFTWLATAGARIFAWFMDNWTTIPTDAFELIQTAAANFAENISNLWRPVLTWIMTVFSNLANNIKAFFKGVWDWIRSGGNKPLEFKFRAVMDGVPDMSNLKWKPLLEGAEFQSSKLEMPEWKPSGVDQGEWDKSMQRIAENQERIAAANKPKDPPKRGAKQEDAIPEKDKKKSDLGRSLDLRAFRDQLQQGLFDKDKQRGLKAQEKAADGIGEAVKKLEIVNTSVKALNVGALI